MPRACCALLSGRTHQVITGVCLVKGRERQRAAEVTFVRFTTLSDPEIEEYVATGEPMDKAGAYAIQGRAGRWVPRIHGCYFNVVGLPLALVSSMVEGMQLTDRDVIGLSRGGFMWGSTGFLTAYVVAAIIAANNAVRGASESMRIDSFSACAPRPTAPMPSRVGMPRTEVKFPSEPPPVEASSNTNPSDAASSFA